MSKRKIIIDNSLKDILLKIKNDTIASIFLAGEVEEELLAHPEKEFDYFGLSHANKGHISYLTKEKIEKVEAEEVKDYWRPKYRYTARPGSVIKKFLNFEDHRIIESFSTSFLSLVDPPNYRMEVVKGEDIITYYHHANYSQQSGSLGGSCMKGSPAHFFDIYKKNEDTINMLVMFDQHNKVMGRSLVWIGKDFKLMDRIYVTNDLYLSYFYNWVSENDCIYKEHNNWMSPKQLMYRGEKIAKDLTIELKDTIFDTYPYLDTFKWLDKDLKKIHNFIPEDRKENLKVLGDHMGRTFPFDTFTFCQISNQLCTAYDSTYLDYLGLRVARNLTQRSYVLGTFILREHAIHVEEIGDYIFNEKYDHLNNKEAIDKRKLEQEEKRKRGTKLKEELEWYESGSSGGSSVDGVFIGELTQQPSYSEYVAEHSDPITVDTVTITDDEWMDSVSEGLTNC